MTIDYPEEEAAVAEYRLSQSVFQAYLAEAWEQGLNTGLGYGLAMAVSGVDTEPPENPYWHEATED